jgi:hypothetical protein
VVDHPGEEYVTRAEMTRDALLDEADMPSVDVCSAARTNVVEIVMSTIAVV